MLWEKDICLGVAETHKNWSWKILLSRIVITLFRVLVYFWCPWVGILQINSLLYFPKFSLLGSSILLNSRLVTINAVWYFQVWLSILTTFWTSVLYLLPLVLLLNKLMNQLCVVDTGGTKKVCFTFKLAARVHHGRHTGSAEKGDGFSSQSQASSAPGRHLFLAHNDDNPNLCCCVMTLEV